MAVAASSRNMIECVNKLKNVNPDKFRELVVSHLSIMLDLDGETLNDLIGEEELISIKKKKTKTVPTIDEQFFGSVLSHKHIEILLPLFDFLGDPETVKSEGVFRKNGNVERQRQLRDKLEKHELVHYSTSPFTVHDCAGILKAFIGELPDVPLTSRHFNAYTQIASMKDESRQMITLQLLIQLLPQENISLLKQLLKVLRAVAEEPSSLMDDKNLAIVFAMHVIVPKKLSTQDQRSATEQLTQVLSLIIRRSEELFSYPAQLVLDVTQYFAKYNNSSIHTSSSTKCLNVSKQGSGVKTKRGRRVSIGAPKSARKDSERFTEEVESRSNADDDVVISPSVVFVDRKASNAAAETNNTMTALAELCAHIASMPESSRKGELIERVKVNYRSLYVPPTDTKPSVGKSFKQLFSSRKSVKGGLSAMKAASQYQLDQSTRRTSRDEIPTTPCAGRSNLAKRLFESEETSSWEDSNQDLQFTPLALDDTEELDSVEGYFDSADDLNEDDDDDIIATGNKAVWKAALNMTGKSLDFAGNDSELGDFSNGSFNTTSGSVRPRGYISPLNLLK